MASSYSSGRKAGRFLYGAGVMVGIVGVMVGVYQMTQPFGVVLGLATIVGSILGGAGMAFLAEAGMAVFDIAENTARDKK